MMMKEFKEKKLKMYFLFFFFSFLLISCKAISNSPVEPLVSERGQLVSSTKLGNYGIQILQAYINLQIGNQQIEATLQYDVDAYSITYRTIDSNGNLIVVSGLICVPVGKNNLSLISIHHGTQTNRSKVGSINAFNTPEAIIAASLGFYAVMPDYIGLGVSNLIHPYHIAKSSADVVIDMIRAGRAFASKSGINLNGQVFLAGYSEGGYVTLAAHKEIQQKYNSEINVTASAPMAGAYDLNLTAKKIIQGKIYNEPSYLAFFFVAYNNYYGWDKLYDFFNPIYAAQIPSLFDGVKTTDEINNSLTANLYQLFKTSFINSYLTGTETTVTTAFNDNSLLNWTPSAPIKFYHGSADECVPYENSVAARDKFFSNGANVELVTITGGTHLTSVLPSVIGAINWFDTIRIKKTLAVK